ncbi:MAG: hypothetical protein R3192_11625 [Woeseiaceae bacterium]|nr:hypothetical protein [Woeseiaceae bacterium]
MKKILISTIVSCVIVLAGSVTSSAQDDMLVIPVELYTCKYNNRQGPDDLDRVVARWNSWADSNAMDYYAAWTLTPYYYSPEQEFDVIWLGAAKDAVALGRGQSAWLGGTHGLQDDFDEVLTCDSHSNFASINFKMPPENATPQNSILTFSDCTFEDGASFTALGAAMRQWAEYLDQQGSTAGIWHWYPVYGGGGEQFDFKWLEAFSNLEELGADYERYGNGGGFVTAGRLMGHLIDCDSARAYIAESRRFVQLR